MNYYVHLSCVFVQLLTKVHKRFTCALVSRSSIPKLTELVVIVHFSVCEGQIVKIT